MYVCHVIYLSHSIRSYTFDTSDSFASAPSCARPLDPTVPATQRCSSSSAASSIKNALLSLALASEKSGFGVAAKCVKAVTRVATKSGTACGQERGLSGDQENSIAHGLLLLAEP